MPQRAIAKAVATFEAQPDPVEALDFKTLKELEREYIMRVYEATKRNKIDTSRLLGITVKTLYNKLEEYGEHVRRAKNPPYGR